MDKPTSIIAALNAGKLPSTQQFNAFIDHLQHVGLVKFQQHASSGADTVMASADAPDVVQEEKEALSAQGKLLADDLRDVLSADRNLLNNKNADNILQEAIWHLSQGSISTSTTTQDPTKKDVQQDMHKIQQCLSTLLKSLSSSLSSTTTTSLLPQFLSFIRTSLSDALEAVQGKASDAKEGLRKVEGEVQEGKRDQWGRDKERLEQEKDPKVAWEHGVDTFKGVGSSVIEGVQGAKEGLEQGQEKVEGEVKEVYFSIWKRAQSDPEYRQALETLISILQTRLHTALDTIDTTSDSLTLSSFINDPSEHISKGLSLLRTFIERLAGGGKTLEPLLAHIRTALTQILRNPELHQWFDDYFSYAQRALADVHYAHSDSAKTERKDLFKRWKTLSEQEEHKWEKMVDGVKAELNEFERAVRADGDLQAAREAKEKLGEDLKNGLRERVGGGVERAVEEITWFWQDLFKVYLPNVLGQLKELPIPRTEYKDDEIEFVLENLDISHLNLLPSRVYIRNITDISIQTTDDPSASADKQLATLTHIQLQAVQMHLKDVSFWYKDKNAMMVSPGEITGLLEMKLPPQGINVDLKVRMIPAKARGKISRDEQKRFHVVDKCAVEISDDVEVTVRESNHAMLMNVFSGVVKNRIKEAMERTLTGQVRALVDWVDGLAYDVGERRKVFEDAGLGGGPAVVAALWSEIGKMEREAEEGGGSMGVRGTGTGIIFEEKREIPTTAPKAGTLGKFEYEAGKETKGRVLAVGAEPQVLSGEKRGPLGTGSESLDKTVQDFMGERGMDVDIEGAKKRLGEEKKKVGDAVQEGKKRVEGFRKTVLRKEAEEKKSIGDTWKSNAFDF